MSFHPKMWVTINEDEFERLCTLLLKSEDPAIKPIEGSGGDEGIDAYSGNFGGKKVVYQMKFFPQRLKPHQKRSIVNSLETVTSKHEISKWYLVIPRDPTPAERRWFENLDNANETELTWFGNINLEALLYKNKDILDQFFDLSPFRDRTIRKKTDLMKEIIDELFDENKIQEISEHERNKRLSTDKFWKIGNKQFYFYSEEGSYSLPLIANQIQRLRNNDIIVIFGSQNFIDRFAKKALLLPIARELEKAEIKNAIINYKRKLIGT